jgi:MFS family permease
MPAVPRPVEAPAGPRPTGRGAWLTRTVLVLGVASLLSDLGHEAATAALPAFLLAIGGSAAALGWIEGVSDAGAGFVKLWAGWHSDRWPRKPLVVAGYALTGLATGSFALASHWGAVLVSRTVGWAGRGLRTPGREAMLADGSPAHAYGRAFGFHRAMDSAGAVLGPVLALALLPRVGYRPLFALTLVPGLLAGAVVLLAREARRAPVAVTWMRQMRALPQRFWAYIAAVGVFGLGNFAHSLLILRATQALAPRAGMVPAAATAVLLYTVHNVLYTAASYPVGALGDRVPKPVVLAAGYGLFGALSVILAVTPATIGWLTLAFVLAGLYIAAVDTIEGALAAEVLPEASRGTGFGILAAVNSVGDLFSSAAVGTRWTALGPAVGFGYAAALSLAGALGILWWMAWNNGAGRPGATAGPAVPPREAA